MDKIILSFRGLLRRFFTGNSPAKSRFKYEGIVKYLPLIVCGGFFLLTILWFAFGPYDWGINNGIKLYSFLIACFVALVSGYFLAVKKGKVSRTKSNLNTNNILILCSIVFLILFIPTVFARTGKWYPDIIRGIFDTGKAYQISKFYSIRNPSIVEYIRIILSPITIMVMPITLFFMPKLSKAGKFLGILVITCILLLGISQGINKACADFTIQIVLFLLLLLFSNHKAGFNIKYRLKIIGLIVIVCSLFITYYYVSMHSRVSIDSVIGENITDIDSIPSNSSSNLSKEEIDSSIKDNATFGFASGQDDNIFFKIIPKKLQPTALFLTSYITHGYKGLSIAMDQKFSWSYGLGFSAFLRHNVLKIIGKSDLEKEIYANTYEAKTSNEGWATGAVWSSFFIFPASDITFIGTILLIFLIGYIFGLSWKDTLLTENIFSVVVFFSCCIMIFYFSANNQIFQNGEGFIGFTSAFILWQITRHMPFKRKRNLIGR